MRASAGAATLLLAVLRSCSAGHPCEQEVTAACPDRPGAEIAACLKDKSQHDTPAAISSECTDFIALHTACAHEIENICDEAYFTDDTIPCLTQWTDMSQLSERCAGVVKWAVPQDDDEGDGPTDELGMSKKDYEEKKEWQRKRKEARGDAIGRMKMKDADRQKEEDRVALENLKREDPEAYRQTLELQAEEQRQQAEIKRKERMMAAAYERRKREEQGIKDEDAEQEPKKPKKKKKAGSAAQSKPAGSWFPALAGLTVIGALCGFGVYAVSRKSEAKGKRAPRKPKKK